MDLATFDPLPRPSGDKGLDAIRYASAAVRERQLRRGLYDLYCAQSKCPKKISY